jgi:hypothetical protein
MAETVLSTVKLSVVDPENYVPVTFVVLTHGTIYSDFERKTKEGKFVKDLITESRQLPLRSVVMEKGKRIVLRYLAECPDTVVQEEQVKLGFPKPNDPNEFSRQSMSDNWVSNDFVVSKNAAHLEYLLRAGWNEGLPKTSQRVPEFGAYYKEYKPQLAVKQNNAFTKDQVKALSKFESLNESDQKTVLLKIKGSFYSFSEDKEDWYADITAIVNASTEHDRSAIDVINGYAADKKNAVVDVSVLIGIAIDKKLLSFVDDIENVLARGKVTDKYIKIFSVTSTLPLESKLSLFSDFLKTKDGEPVLNNIKESIK